MVNEDEFLLKHYDYALPTELIAYEPCDKGQDKLLLLGRRDGSIIDASIHELLSFVDNNVLVVLNNTKVVPARLLGKKVPSGGKVDCILVKPLDVTRKRWQVLIKSAGKLKKGQEIIFEDKLLALYRGDKVLEFADTITYELLESVGRMPLPPYIKRLPEQKDKILYQTIYAKNYGAIASPTAGLHFDKSLLLRLQEQAWGLCYVTLHVGYGTFSPIRCDDIRGHVMHKEFFIVEEKTMDLLRRAREESKKIMAVGTTVVRVLETIKHRLKENKIIKGWTDIYIYPPYRFEMVDMLFTNFHLPKSSLLLLVSAFAGRDNIIRAYNHAIEKRYRFFSYGDAMLIY